MLHSILARAPESLRLVLASGSPRRKGVFTQLGINVDIIESTFEENLDKSLFEHPKDFAMENAKQKALEVANRICQMGQAADVVIGADSIVVIEDKILEKPKTKEKATEMLQCLSGKKHEVYTGMAFVVAGGKEPGKAPKVFYERTEVEFADLTDHVIETYVASLEPLDKAGAYGYQGIGGTLVKRIHGDYYNVVGFPLHRFCIELQQWIESR